MINLRDKELSAIAIKSLKEINYHVKWSGEWVIRLGDGTEESRRRMENAITELWPYTGEMFSCEPYEPVDVKLLNEEWMQKVKMVFDEAGLVLPENVFMQTGGKKGIHTEHFGYMLSEMQYLQRVYPGAEW
jgi:ring-1,2-phenylacetyl-CoA epoxidase subunit PaaC